MHAMDEITIGASHQTSMDIEVRIEARLRHLSDRWRAASVADRLLAVDRLVLEGELDERAGAALERLNAEVQGLWMRVRQDRRRAADDGQRLGVYARELELMQLESRRDAFIVEHDLVEQLYVLAESFLLERPYDRSFRPLRELLRARPASEGSFPIEVRRARAAARRTRSHIRILAPAA